jgi:hypothetical protein
MNATSINTHIRRHMNSNVSNEDPRKLPSSFFTRRALAAPTASDAVNNNHSGKTSSSPTSTQPTTCTGCAIHRPLYHSSPTLATNTPTSHAASSSCVATSHSNPTFHKVLGGGLARCSSRGRGLHQNASFGNNSSRPPQPSSSLHPLQKSATTRLGGSRTSLVGLDKIIQRSSSKSVKQTLFHLEELCSSSKEEDATPAPWTKIEMLLELSADIYYRVVMKKCRGVDIFTKLMGAFPELEAPCNELLLALTTQIKDSEDDQVGITTMTSPRSTFSNMLLMEPYQHHTTHGGQQVMLLPPTAPSMIKTTTATSSSPSSIETVLRMSTSSATATTAAASAALLKPLRFSGHPDTDDDHDDDRRQIIECQDLGWLK